MATVQQIKRKLVKKVAKAMESTKIRVRDIMYDACMDYYGEYDPYVYQRTYQIARAVYNMANASVKARMVGASFEVYVDSSMFNHVRDEWSEERILAGVMRGGEDNGVMRGGEDSHGGAMPGGTPVWTQGEGIVNEQIKGIVKQELIKAGIPII